ncbi:MAG: hypothetical protein V3U98_00225 [Acidobacteriota bacterium]
MRTLICGALLVLFSSAVVGASAPARFVEILEVLHPDYATFVHQVRAGKQRLHPIGLLAGLVRPGGTNPLDPRDAPVAGKRNDIIIYDDTFERGTSAAWRSLIVDHEYFHAKHLGRGVKAPAVDFGEEQINRHYYEALAWGYNLERMEQGRYPGLRAAEQRTARRRFLEHRKAFRRWLLRNHAPAWLHYGRFLEPAEAVERP